MASKSPKTLVIGVSATVLIALIAVLVITQTDILVRLFGPPAVQMQETFAAKPDGPSFDHSAFDAVVKQYVDEDGWVDYAGLNENPGELEAYIASVADAPYDDLGRDEKLALLINAYNAFTLELILDYYPVDSIKDIPESERWADERWEVGDNTWSLNQIEHEQIRPNFAEPRIHFALVCAAVGCPPLRNEAYTADRLDEQLEDQTIYVHTHPRWFRYEQGANTIYLTALYQWYKGDFEQHSGTILEYVAQYSDALRADLDAGHTPSVSWLEYDWALNTIENAPE